MTFRRRYLILALTGIVLIAAGSLSWPARRLPLGVDLALQAEAALGHPVTSDDSAITFLPLPRIDFRGVAIGPDGSIARAGRVSVRLRLLPLLTGRAEAREITVYRPRIVWDGPQRPRDLWLLTRDRLIAAASLQDTKLQDAKPLDTTPQDAAAALPVRVSIIDGTVLTHNETRTLLRRLNADMTWPAANRPFDLHAAALWRGEQVDLRVDKLHPASLAAGLNSPVVVRLSAQPLSFSFAGVIGTDDMPDIDGLLNFRTGSLARAVAWLRLPLNVSRHTGQVALSGSATLNGDGLSVPDARIEIEGGTLEGAVAARYTDSGRILVSATLDAAVLDVNRIIAQPATVAGQHSPVRALSLGGNGGAGNDLDVRLSISRALIGPLEMQQVAAGILVSGGRVEFAVNQARLDGGSLRGRLQFVNGEDEVTARLSGAFEGIDAQKTLHRLFGGALFAGSASGNVSLASRGRTAQSMAASLGGDISLRIDSGYVLGVDLPAVLARAQQSPLATALDWRGGRTPFNLVESSLAVTDGIGSVRGVMTASDVVGKLTGSVGIAQRTLDLRAQVWRDDERRKEQQPAHPEGSTAYAQALAANQTADPVGFPIEISGSWDYPIVTPDIRLLIERSSAVATPPSSADAADSSPSKSSPAAPALRFP